MAGPIQTISYFARRLIQFEQKFARRNPATLPETAELFRSTGRGLNELIDAVEAETSLDPACEQLTNLLPRLEKETQAEIGSPEAEKIFLALQSSFQAGAIQLQLQAGVERETLLEELEKSAILIRALADGLYVGEQNLR